MTDTSSSQTTDDADAPDHRQLVHDLRMRVLAGEDISAHEMLLIVESVRRGRRAAGAPAGRTKAAKGRKGTGKGKSTPSAPPVDLSGILDTAI